MCIPGAATVASVALPLATTAMQGALNINSSLAQTRALQEQQDEKYKQMVEEIRGRNISLYGKTLRNQDYYKQRASEATDAATRAYFKTDVELDQAMGKANLATQKNLGTLIGKSGKGAAKGLGGSTAQRIDMQAIKDWGRKDAAIRHGMNEKTLGAEFNKESVEMETRNKIKIAGRELNKPAILEPTPGEPDPIDWRPGVNTAIAQTGLDLFSVISQPSPFEFGKG